MKKVATILLLTGFLFACEKYPEPGNHQLESFSFYIYGNNQSAEGNHELKEQVGVQVDKNALYPDKSLKFYTVFEITEGGGDVADQRVDMDNEGKMLTSLTLGDKGNNQVLSGKIYDETNKKYGEFTIQATAFFTDKINKIESGHLLGIIDMVSDTVRKRTMMYNQRQIWIIKDKFYSWEPMEFPFNTYIRFIEMTSDGTVFAACWDGTLYKTEDWGDNWKYAGKPIPDNPYFYNFNITSDDYLWASKNEYGVFYSKDKGITWVRDSSGRVKNTTLGPIYKYKNSYLTIAGNPLSIIQKYETDSTWTDINTPEYSLSMYIPNDSTIIAQNQGGFTLHKSNNDGLSFKQVLKPYTTMGGGDLWHVYNRFKNNYYVLAPSSGVWRTKDFENFEHLIEINTYQSKLFIDHFGTIYAAGNVFVNAKDEATFVLPQSLK